MQIYLSIFWVTWYQVHFFNARVKAAWPFCFTNSLCLHVPEEQRALTCITTGLHIFPKSVLSWGTANSLVRTGKWKCRRNDSIHRTESAQKVLSVLLSLEMTKWKDTSRLSNSKGIKIPGWSAGRGNILFVLFLFILWIWLHEWELDWNCFHGQIKQ